MTTFHYGIIIIIEADEIADFVYLNLELSKLDLTHWTSITLGKNSISIIDYRNNISILIFLLFKQRLSANIRTTCKNNQYFFVVIYLKNRN